MASCKQTSWAQVCPGAAAPPGSTSSACPWRDSPAVSHRPAARGHGSWYGSTRTDRPQHGRTDTRPTQGHRPRVPGGMSTGALLPCPVNHASNSPRVLKAKPVVPSEELVPKQGCDGAVRGEAPASATCSRWFLSG